MRHIRQLATKTADATTGQNVDFSVPGWARAAIFFINLTAVAGTTPLFDFKLQHIAPDGSGAVEDADASVVQLSAADMVLLTLDPAITVAANERVSVPLSTNMRAVVTQDRTTGNETYTYTVWVEFYS
jgi:hypothetical protein